MNLIIDIGNTSAKIAVYENTQQRFFTRVLHQKISETLHFVIRKFNPRQAIVSNVSAVKVDWDEFHSLPVITLSHTTPLPVKIHYQTPETLGLDRMALVCGAAFHQPEKNCLIIDAGTCITYDFLSARNEYSGGAIAPGLTMRLKAMHQFTGNLPLLSFPQNQPEIPFVGKSTRECMLSGAFWGMLMEINGNIHRYEEQFGDVYVFLTGGDANMFEKHLKNRIFATPFLLLDGLNYILEYNL